MGDRQLCRDQLSDWIWELRLGFGKLPAGFVRYGRPECIPQAAGHEPNDNQSIPDILPEFAECAPGR